MSEQADEETVRRIRSWLLDQIEKKMSDLNPQVLIWELTHIVDGLPLPKIGDS